MTAAALDFNKHQHREAAANDAINAIIDAMMLRKRAGQAPRSYVGASAIGAECSRAIQFEFAQTPKEKDFSPTTLTKFDLGHMGEELARFRFLDSGFELVTKNQRTGQPFRFAQLDGRFCGTPDGVFIAGPEIAGVGYPCLWETKSTGGKTYREIEKHGLKKARPAYYAQVAVYQAYLDLTDNPAIFTVTNLDSAEQIHLLIPFDAEVAQQMTDKVVAIIKATDAGELLPRPFADMTDFRCKMCSYVQRCWSLPA